MILHKDNFIFMFASKHFGRKNVQAHKSIQNFVIFSLAWRFGEQNFLKFVNFCYAI